jgi:aspartyl-tRNA(Asn)/glutamyl-tRNA(Gln) amidotransferase subunit B
MSAPADVPYRVIVGMEVHLQLKTRSKCFCACPTSFGAPPNTNVCPVCLGLPGALPVLNHEAVRLAVRTGLALGCTIAAETKWDRKNYFYPDLPKGYQISQYDRPLCAGGAVPIDADDGSERVVRIRRAHLEEDTGKSFHEGKSAHSRIDLNRCGTPLLEIVSEPDLASAEEAGRYLDALRAIVSYVGTSDGNMQEGNLRCEPNVNLAYPDGDRTAIVEVKNVNSVGGVERAIRFEALRQDAEHRQRGATSRNTPRSTRGWDDDRGETVHQRSKESADDYRYFPEPDLPLLRVDPAFVLGERQALPELPRARRERFVSSLRLSAYDAGVLVADRSLADWFEAALAPRPGAAAPDPKAVANLVTGEVLRYVKATGATLDRLPAPPGAVGELAALVSGGTINLTTAKDVFREMVASGEGPRAIVERKGLAQVSDEAVIRAACEAAVAAEPKAAADVRSGNEKAIGRLVGTAMKRLQGKGNPAVVNAVLRGILKS